MIDLDKDSEPDIYNAIKRNALLENVTLDAEGHIDFHDTSVTENTRVSYPIDHIEKIVRPVSAAPAAKNVDLPVRRCVWRTSSGICTDSGADRVLFPVRIYCKTGRNRARHHRAYSHVFCLFRTGLPGTASDQICGGTGKENESKRSESISGEYRMEWKRQAYFH